MKNWDVIVIGAGSAGLPLAIKAAERGAKVLQLEADYRIGGTLHWSSGQISAAGTKLQRSVGIDDSPDEHFRDAQRIAKDSIDPVVLRTFVDHAAHPSPVRHTRPIRRVDIFGELAKRSRSSTYFDRCMKSGSKQAASSCACNIA